MTNCLKTYLEQPDRTHRPLDDRRVVGPSSPLDDRRVVRASYHSTIVEWSTQAGHSTIVEWSECIEPLDDR
ncbi:hypothetical protein F2Q69_00058929 [Brassica cretica]|uniref:Uncharacterized protein n=1 Tax=Brassica cretica TaxID=69181 RepID=A0A8S9RBE2_BRACR|nr:hypothetical protein F2Q69_00058929 [Brassica cretica]